MNASAVTDERTASLTPLERAPSMTVPGTV